ncbi:5314_t:CDS:2 [Paraglomus occultum]|uniref:5314_t:CDS:1 n=1 Tax=Paraglomus occultum TaxID=144539 RepID=A0A9N8VQ94_9GLOM|nr:5314_t:CDS:2 [Paraglomus occultum]
MKHHDVSRTLADFLLTTTKFEYVEKFAPPDSIQSFLSRLSKQRISNGRHQTDGLISLYSVERNACAVTPSLSSPPTAFRSLGQRGLQAQVKRFSIIHG